VLVLEDRQVWGVYGQGGLAHGVVQGQVAVSGTTFSGAARDFYMFGGLVSNITVAGSFTPGASITGSLAGPNPGTFSGAYATQYDQPANPSDLAGTWTATAASSTGTTTSTVTVDAFGNITASNVFCTMTGTGLPRASGKNVFNVSLTFAGASCLFNGKTVSGVAVVQNNAGVRDLTIAALLPDRSDGFLATARR
jgi:hypothetical protein